ncbi:hypothetical protein [Pontibacter liquoris]|uniref:hypothetical protein n=1 Tax=Pontibacter liquoris TaxID=2905677 RepID=UPI001FA71C3D|nr:hypothetical protein [Pontibacter liquoris]
MQYHLARIAGAGKPFEGFDRSLGILRGWPESTSQAFLYLQEVLSAFFDPF